MSLPGVPVTVRACAACGWPNAPHQIASDLPLFAGKPVQLCGVCALPGSPFSAPLLGGRDVRATDTLRGLAWALNIVHAAAEHEASA